MTTPTSTATKRCPGFIGIGQPAHELPADLEHFNSNKGGKDGLSSRCRVCGNAYGKAWAARARAIAKADAIDPGREGGIVRDRALDEARRPIETYATSNGHQQLTHPDGSPVFTGRADQVAEREAAAPPALEVAKGLARPGWTVEAVGGNVYDVPTEPETVQTPEGQQALEAVNAATVAERRRRDAERKRTERAAKKQAAATAR